MTNDVPTYRSDAVLAAAMRITAGSQWIRKSDGVTLTLEDCVTSCLEKDDATGGGVTKAVLKQNDDGALSVIPFAELSGENYELYQGDVSVGSRWRHNKTGGVYEVLMLGCLEGPGVTCVVYRSMDPSAYGQVWIRPLYEFTDGRFSA